MMPSQTRRQLLVAMLAAFVAGCAGGPSKESTGEYIDDTAITAKVKTALLKDPEVGGLAINVESFKGTVQLSGFVKTEQERTKAAQVTRSVSGVKYVKNDLVVK